MRLNEGPSPSVKRLKIDAPSSFSSPKEEIKEEEIEAKSKEIRAEEIGAKLKEIRSSCKAARAADYPPPIKLEVESTTLVFTDRHTLYSDFYFQVYIKELSLVSVDNLMWICEKLTFLKHTNCNNKEFEILYMKIFTEINERLPHTWFPKIDKATEILFLISTEFAIFEKLSLPLLANIFEFLVNNQRAKNVKDDNLTAYEIQILEEILKVGRNSRSELNARLLLKLSQYALKMVSANFVYDDTDKRRVLSAIADGFGDLDIKNIWVLRALNERICELDLVDDDGELNDEGLIGTYRDIIRLFSEFKFPCANIIANIEMALPQINGESDFDKQDILAIVNLLAWACAKADYISTAIRILITETLEELDESEDLYLDDEFLETFSELSLEEIAEAFVKLEIKNLKLIDYLNEATVLSAGADTINALRMTNIYKEEIFVYFKNSTEKLLTYTPRELILILKSFFHFDEALTALKKPLDPLVKDLIKQDSFDESEKLFRSQLENSLSASSSSSSSS